jgi:hypothetical protein
MRCAYALLNCNLAQKNGNSTVVQRLISRS